MSYPHHHHHHEGEYYSGEAPPPTFSYEREEAYGYGRPCNDSYGYERVKEETAYQRNERLGELGAVAAGAFALYEGHKAKTDVQHASKHKHEAELAGVAALGSAGYAGYEHHEKEKYKGGW